MPRMAECTLCGPLVGEVRQSRRWRVVVNRNQNLLGKTMLVLHRHAELLPELTLDEWDDLFAQLTAVTARLSEAFAPDHFNYAFLQNADRHVHLHVIPRYASVRDLSGENFEDPDWPHHYAPGRERAASLEIIEAISAVLA